jgi:hypothetical protein
MRILYVLRGEGYFSYHDTVIHHLCAAGHQVHILFDEEHGRVKLDPLIQNSMDRFPSLSRGKLVRRSDIWRRTIYASRELRSYSSYLNRPEQSAYYIDRWENYIAGFIRPIVRCSKTARNLVASRFGQSVMQGFEQLVPPDKGIIQLIQGYHPDVIVASPANMRFSEELDYIKAGKALHIPTVISVLSWDNLTTKGIFHVIPDILLSWNQVQSDEAIQIHRVPPEQVVITGSPFFDKWIDGDRLLVDRALFFQKVRLNPDQPYILYLGSSKNIAEDETWQVKELIDCIRAHPAKEVQRLQILIRPHPSNVEICSAIEDEGIQVWPKERKMMGSEEFWQDFYNSLKYCTGTVGINTTGMIDAVINDRPGATIMSERYRLTQVQSMHFCQLLKANVLEVADTVPACVEILRDMLSGVDRKKAERNQFIHDFVRPHGPSRPAGYFAARAISLASHGKTAVAINSMLGADDIGS